MLTVAGVSRRLNRLLGAQEFPQHPAVTSLAHRECQFVPVETNDLAAPTALDHDSFGTQASCLLTSSFFHAAGGTPAYPFTLPVSDFFP